MPLAVIVNPCEPTVAVLGLTNDRVEEDVWMLRFVLYWEQADASPQATSATISHFREGILNTPHCDCGGLPPKLRVNLRRNPG